MFTCNNTEMFGELKRSMEREFDGIDLGRMKHFLGIEVTQEEMRHFLPTDICPGHSVKIQNGEF